MRWRCAFSLVLVLVVGTATDPRARVPPQAPAPSEAAKLLDAAERLRNTGTAANLKASLETYDNALKAARAAGDRKLEGAILTGLGRAHDALGDRRRAIALFTEAIPLHQAAADKSAESSALNYMALSHDFLGERTEATRLLERALPLAREAGDRRVEAITLNNLGLIQGNTGNRQKALEYYEQALVIHREVGNQRGQAVTLTNIGTAYDQLGDRDRALKYLNEALPIRRQIGEPREEATILNNIGTVHFRVDEYAEAIQNYEAAIPLWRTAGDKAGEAATLHNIANAFEWRGDLQGAMDRYEAALVLERASQFRVGEGNTLTNLGRVYSTLGQREQALDSYTRALALHRAVGNRSSEASVLTSLGMDRFRQGALDDAVARFGEALTIWRAIADRYGEARTLLNLGGVHRAKGDYAAATAVYQQAQDLARAVNSRRTEAVAIGSRAIVELSAGRPAAALPLFDQSLALQREIRDVLAEPTTRYNRARTNVALGDLPAAHDDLQSAIALAEATRTSVASADLRASYFATVQDYFELDLDVMMRMHAAAPDRGWATRAFELSERARARSFIDILAEARLDIRAGVDPALLARQRDLAAALSAKAERQARLLGGPHTDAQAQALADDIRTLTTEHREVEAKIRATSPRYASLTAQEPPAADALRRDVLDDHTWLVEYALGATRSYAFLVSREGVQAFELAARATIDAAATEFYRQARAPETASAAAAAAQQLSRLLLAPVKPALGTRRLAIVASGSLEYIPFAALPDPATGKPLLAAHEIAMLPSASALATLRASAKPLAASPSLLLFADPVFTADDPRVNAGSAPAAPASPDRPVERSLQQLTDQGTPARLDRLLGSRREATSITAVFPRGRAIEALDFDANRTAATAAAVATRDIVHFATHAFLNTARPELSGIVLSLVDRSGAPQRGFLGLSEIFNLRLGAGLVVLSACQTALGKEIRGEGLVGLSRAFMYAGAPRVVASLWKVDDAATAELMRRFYQGLLGPAKLTPAAALRAAQLALMNDPRWRAPYYWAPFVLQGEWR